MLLLPSRSTVTESLLTYVGCRNSALYALFLQYKDTLVLGFCEKQSSGTLEYWFWSLHVSMHVTL